MSHNNIDDGWDLYTKSETGPIGPVTIEDSLSYDNGTLSDGTVNSDGDRNGYKLGGDGIEVDHIVRRNIAYSNGHHGFTYNSNPGSMTVSDNVGIDNAERNFSFDKGTSVFRGNVSCRADDGSNDKTVGDADSSNQFWTGSDGPACSAYSGAMDWSFMRRRLARRHLRRQQGDAVAVRSESVVTASPSVPPPRPGGPAGARRPLATGR